jgi:PBP1b-binding outer membrane lipoprotein LpoB
MKNIRTGTAMLIILLLVAFLVSGCGSILVPRDGEQPTGGRETRQYDYRDFTKVDISSAFDYEIRQSDTYSISITASSNLFDDIKVTKRGRTLVIGREAIGFHWAGFRHNPNVEAVITMPQLHSLDGSGATDGIVADFNSAENLDISLSGASSLELVDVSAGNTVFDLSGASQVEGDIAAQTIEFDLSGASKIQMEGSAESMVVDASGASSLKLADFKVKDAHIALSGASDSTINLDGNLDVDLSGASTLEYIGKPALGIVDISSSSTLKEK